LTICAGLFLEAAPLPPAAKRPHSRLVSRSDSLTAPQTVVVTPLECQSKPSTHPNAWNQYGSERRRSTSAGPYSSTICVRISRERRTIRENSHAGAFPPCRGGEAYPARFPIGFFRLIPPL